MGTEYLIGHENQAVLVILLIVTCSIYYFVLLYRWIVAINKASDKPLVDPAVGIILSIVTCSLAAIYFEYEIVLRAEKIARQDLPSGMQRSSLLKPPASNLKEIVLFGNIAAFAIGFFSAGFLAVVSIIFQLWLVCAIQQALEYAFDVPQD